VFLITPEGELFEPCLGLFETLGARVEAHALGITEDAKQDRQVGFSDFPQYQPFRLKNVTHPKPQSSRYRLPLFT
jgi:hypothetical protein